MNSAAQRLCPPFRRNAGLPSRRLIALACAFLALHLTTRESDAQQATPKAASRHTFCIVALPSGQWIPVPFDFKRATPSQHRHFKATDAEAKAGSDNDREAALVCLRHFLARLARGDDRGAHELVAPSTRSGGDPIAYRAKTDFESFVGELPPVGNRNKFEDYVVEQIRRQSDRCIRITIKLAGWDTDETMLIKENGKWYVADPIHIIR